ncbi:hypothetical protein ARTHRO9V_280059 [Arthrobacter sp. 9V]|uniref:hypothetical protein n=1 Tax=Arthrobacter sp. 9V TaxID=2653132 RepID=UPI0012F0F2BA|nr:hypothetical protein [Arthrobacter sp. 9V]VXC42134.1 hypothetical protein ARTHRO9V_280059 [Arthrobacter sp. 9V]
MWTTTSRVILKIEDSGSKDQQLDEACALLRTEATDCGVLVTQVDYFTFEIALSPTVGLGVTHEIDLLRSAADLDAPVIPLMQERDARPPKGPSVPESREYGLARDKHYEEADKHPISIWTSLAPGDAISLKGLTPPSKPRQATASSSGSETS